VRRGRRLAGGLGFIIGFVVVGGLAMHSLQHAVPPVEEEPFFPRFDPATVRAIEMQQGGERVFLDREDGRWRVLNVSRLTVDEAAIQAMLEAFAEPWEPAEALAGGAAARDLEDAVGLGRTQRVEVEFLGHTDFVAGLEIGDTLPEGGRAVRLAHGDTIWRADVPALEMIAPVSLQRWFSGDLVLFAPDDIEILEVENDRGSARVIWADGTKTYEALTGGVHNEMASDEMDGLRFAIAGWPASPATAEELAQASVADPSLRLRARSDNGRWYELVAGNPTSGGRIPVQVDGRPIQFMPNHHLGIFPRLLQ